MEVALRGRYEKTVGAMPMVLCMAMRRWLCARAAWRRHDVEEGSVGGVKPQRCLAYA